MIAPERCATSGLDGGVLAFTLALARPLIGLDVVGLAIHRQAGELQREQGISGEASGALHGSHTPGHIGAERESPSRSSITMGAPRVPWNVSPT